MSSVSKPIMLLSFLIVISTITLYHEYGLATKTMFADTINSFNKIQLNNNHIANTTKIAAQRPTNSPTNSLTNSPTNTLTNVPREIISNSTTIPIQKHTNDGHIFYFGVCYSGFNQLEMALQLLGYNHYEHEHITLSTDFKRAYAKNKDAIFILLNGSSTINNETKKYDRYKRYIFEKIINTFELMDDFVKFSIVNLYDEQKGAEKWRKLCNILNVSVPNVTFPGHSDIGLQQNEQCNNIDLQHMKSFLNLSDADINKYESFIFNVGDEITLFNSTYSVQNSIKTDYNVVFIIENHENHEKYALKKSYRCGILKGEYKVLKLFENMKPKEQQAVATVYGYDFADDMCVMQMQFLENTSTLKAFNADEYLIDDNGILNDMIPIRMQQIIDCYENVSSALSILYQNNLYHVDLHSKQILYKIIESNSNINKWQCYLIDMEQLWNLTTHAHQAIYPGPTEYYSCWAFHKLMTLQKRQQHSVGELNYYAKKNVNYNLAALMIDTFMTSLRNDNLTSNDLKNAYKTFRSMQRIAWTEIVSSGDRSKYLNKMNKMWEMRMNYVQILKRYLHSNNNYGFDRYHFFSHIENNYHCSTYNNNSHTHKLLSFAHIAKTGGTAVYSAIDRSNTLLGNNWIGLRQREYKIVCKFYCGIGYLPPSCFDISHTPYYNKSLQPIFTVIRNPYARLLSHFDYHHSTTMNETEIQYPDYCDVEYFNKYISHIVDEYWSIKDGSKGIRNCHIMPQYQYVYYFDDFKSYENIEIAQMNKKLSPFITDILKFESLQNDLNALMDKYKLERVNVARTNLHKTYHKTCVQDGLSIHNLTTDNLRKVNALYKADFENFGYQMIHV